MLNSQGAQSLLLVTPGDTHGLAAALAQLDVPPAVIAKLQEILDNGASSEPERMHGALEYIKGVALDVVNDSAKASVVPLILRFFGLIQ